MIGGICFGEKGKRAQAVLRADALIQVIETELAVGDIWRGIAVIEDCHCDRSQIVERDAEMSQCGRDGCKIEIAQLNPPDICRQTQRFVFIYQADAHLLDSLRGRR